MERWVPGLRRLHHLVVWQRDAIARSDHDDELMPEQVLHDGREKITPNTPTHNLGSQTEPNLCVQLRPGSPLPTQPARWPSDAFRYP
jgi:hypothetical protein